MATHSSILALESPMDRGAWHGVTRVRHDLVAKAPPPLPPTYLISPGSRPYHMELRLGVCITLRPVPQGLFSRVQKSHFLYLNLKSELSHWTSISHPCLHVGITGGTLRIQMPGIPELLRWLVVSKVQWRLRITAVVIFFFKINEFYLEILCWTQSLFKFFLRCYRKPFGQPSDFRLTKSCRNENCTYEAQTSFA